jgi:hypothetical protein
MYDVRITNGLSLDGTDSAPYQRCSAAVHAGFMCRFAD